VGKEAACEAVLAGMRVRIKAHLDATGLALRGELRARFTAAELRDVRVEDEQLVLSTPAGELSLMLGSAASKWASALQHPKSVVEKFGIGRADRVMVRRVTNDDFSAELARSLDAPPATTLRGTFDCIVAQFDAAATLGELETLVRRLAPNGALWLVTPKGKGSLVPEGVVRAAIARAGLVDVKISAFDGTHTATKAVIPIARRPAAAARRPA
jgi:hypothetical protein